MMDGPSMESSPAGFHSDWQTSLTTGEPQTFLLHAEIET